MMVTRCGCRRQAAATSARPPHCWRPHQLYNIFIYDNDLRYIIYNYDNLSTHKAYVNTKINTVAHENQQTKCDSYKM